MPCTRQSRPLSVKISQTPTNVLSSQAQQREYTPLRTAASVSMQDTLVDLCAAGRWEEVDALIDQLVTLSEEELAAALRETHGRPQWTSLHYVAIAKPTPPTLRKLVKAGAELEARGSSGSTPLHLAAWTGSVDAARELVLCGANVEARSKTGRTPLMFAARQGGTEMIETLVELGADVNSTDERGRSALHFAAQSSQGESIRKLVKHGARNEPDADGTTPDELADDDAKHVFEDDLQSDWTVAKTIMGVMNVQAWREKLFGLGRTEVSLPPSPPPSPNSMGMRNPRCSSADSERPVGRRELYAAVGAGILISILFPLSRGGRS